MQTETDSLHLRICLNLRICGIIFMFKTAKQQIAFIGIAVALAAFSLASIVNFSDPYAASRLTLVFFYLSLFLFSLGALTLVGILFRHWLSPKLFLINLSASFRQALLISLLVTATFGLLAAKLLFWWVEASLILFFLSIEALLNLKI